MKNKEHSQEFIRATLSFYQVSGSSLEETAQKMEVEIPTLVSWIKEAEESQALDADKTLPFLSRESDVSPKVDDVIKTWMQIEAVRHSSDDDVFIHPTFGENGVQKRKEVLGEGGMGIVYSAVQASMGREVALKELKPNRTEVHFRRALLQEAWIVGLLEHPNILPVYTIEKNKDGFPSILMKKIEGKTWAYYLEHPKEAQETFEYSDFISWNIEIVLQVCNAISYAHDIGFLHRDLKPENIMIGDYGVVFVLDWGLSVALDDRHSSWLPRAKDIQLVAGSPAYMAPEMADVEGAGLSAVTDIYLLGAMMYEVITGTPPHGGESLPEILASIQSFTPTYPTDSCTRFQEIISDCLHLDPLDRYSCVDDLQRDLQKYRTYRNFIPVLSAMNESLYAIHQLVLTQGSRGELYEHFFSARFAFRQLHKQGLLREENRQKFKKVAIEMARWELREHNPETSEILLEPWGEIDASFLQEIDAEKEHQRQEKVRIERLGIARSKTIGIRTRMFVTLLSIITWTLLPAWVLVFDIDITFDLLHKHTLLSLVIFVAIGIWARHSISSTEQNRQVYAILLCEPLFHGFSDLTYQLLGYDSEQVWAMRFMVWLAMIASYSVLLEARMIPISIMYGCATFWIVQNPQHVPQASMILNLVLCCVMYVVWRDDYVHAEDAREIDREEFL